MKPLIKHYDLNYETTSIQAAHAQAKILLKKKENVRSLGHIAGHLLQLKRAETAMQSPNVRSFSGIVRTFVFMFKKDQGVSLS